MSDTPFDEITPRSLLFARLEGERLDQFIYTLRDKVGDSVRVIPVQRETEVLVVDEATMNQMGWFRRS